MNLQKNRHARLVTLALGGALALGAIFTSGCSSQKRVSYVPQAGDVVAATPSRGVEVLLDRAPSAAHVVTGELFAAALSNPQSIELMKEKAAAAGLDGIYWIDCTSTCSGRCSAKGYVYVDRSFAKAAAARAVASE